MLETAPLDTGGASELKGLGEARQAGVGNEDLGSSAFGASRAPQSPRRWSSCTGSCCPLQETVGPELGRGSANSSLTVSHFLPLTARLSWGIPSP